MPVWCFEWPVPSCIHIQKALPEWFDSKLFVRVQCWNCHQIRLCMHFLMCRPAAHPSPPRILYRKPCTCCDGWLPRSPLAYWSCDKPSLIQCLSRSSMPCNKFLYSWNTLLPVWYLVTASAALWSCSPAVWVCSGSPLSLLHRLTILYVSLLSDNDLHSDCSRLRTGVTFQTSYLLPYCERSVQLHQLQLLQQLLFP